MKKEFICQECGKEFKILSTLSNHVGLFHDQKEYYDKYLKKEKEGICICGNSTKYSHKWQKGYNKYCSEECRKKYRVKEIEKTTFKKYGVKNINKLKKFRDKIDKTNLKKYGNLCPMHNNKIRKKIIEKNLENIGVEYPFQSKKIQEKSANIRLKKYGFKYTFESDKLREKIKKTNNRKYGVDFPIQNSNIFNKAQKSRFLIKEYKDTKINYQGSFELDFLEKYYNRYSDIKRGPSIKYKYKNKNKIYHSDFYIPSLNLIIEIKNIFLEKKDKEILNIKEKYCKENGYNWIMIVNKDYSEFEKLIS